MTFLTRIIFPAIPFSLSDDDYWTVWNNTTDASLRQLISSHRPNDFNDMRSFWWSPDGWWNADVGIFAPPQLGRDLAGLTRSGATNGNYWDTQAYSYIGVPPERITATEIFSSIFVFISVGRDICMQHKNPPGVEAINYDCGDNWKLQIQSIEMRGTIPDVLTYDQFRRNKSDPPAGYPWRATPQGINVRDNTSAGFDLFGMNMRSISTLRRGLGDILDTIWNWTKTMHLRIIDPGFPY